MQYGQPRILSEGASRIRDQSYWLTESIALDKVPLLLVRGKVSR
jgi:hypothetical protein